MTVFVIHDPRAQRYLRNRPSFGGFLLWTAHAEEAWRYDTREIAEADALLTWRQAWHELVRVAEIEVPA